MDEVKLIEEIKEELSLSYVPKEPCLLAYKKGRDSQKLSTTEEKDE